MDDCYPEFLQKYSFALSIKYCPISLGNSSLEFYYNAENAVPVEEFYQQLTNVQTYTHGQEGLFKEGTCMAIPPRPAQLNERYPCV